MDSIEFNCAGCHHLAVDRDARGWPKEGAIGYCRLRENPIENLEESWCDNHPGVNFLGFRAPVGPLWIDGLPAVLGGMAWEEEGSGSLCEHCGGLAPGPTHIHWRKEDSKKYFCSPEHYVQWSGDKDPSIPLQEEPSREDVAELRRLHKGLSTAEEGLRDRKGEPVKKLSELLKFTERSLYRFLRARQMIPNAPVDHLWADLFRGGPPETRERINPWMLEVLLSLREILIDPPEMLPGEDSERAYEYARVRWARLVIGDLVDVSEGPEIPKDVSRRFRGRHRPEWTEIVEDQPEQARRVFYLERNPDLDRELRQYFGAATSTD